MKFVIIGSGPTSLGAAYRLNELIEEKTLPSDVEVIIIEKESEVGGLARSITDENNFTWDLGVHITGASKYAKFSQVINDAVSEWCVLPRSVKVFMKHVMNKEIIQENYVPYPAQESVPFFPEEVKSQCLAEIRKSSLEYASSNFGELTKNVFGETLQNIFIRPYNEKVWTVALEELNCAWVKDRVPQPNWEELFRKSNLDEHALKMEETNKIPIYFKYPLNMRGMGELWKKVASKLPQKWLLLNTEAIQVDVKNKKIYTSDNTEYSYDHLISTIPLTKLCNICCLCPEIDLKHSQVALVGIGLRKPQPDFTKSLSWLYFPQKDIIFYRCTFISNFNKSMTPDSDLYWSVICEIGLHSKAEVDQISIMNSTIKGLNQVGILVNADIMSKWFYLLPYGYPIPSITRDVELKTSLNELEKHSIYSRGRFGGWKYEFANQDHSFMIGYEVVDRVLFNIPEQLHK